MLRTADFEAQKKTVTVLGHVGEKAHAEHAATVAKLLEAPGPGGLLAVTAVALARMGRPSAEALAAVRGDAQRVACEALGRMANWRLALEQLGSLASRLQARRWLKDGDEWFLKKGMQ